MKNLMDNLEDSIFAIIGCLGFIVTMGVIAGAFLGSAWIAIKTVLRLFELLF